MKFKMSRLSPIFIVFILGALLGVILENNYNFIDIFRGDFKTKSESEITQITKNSIPQKYQVKLQLFILAGQSNMSGLGELPTKTKTHPKIYVFGNDYRWKLAKEPMDDPINQVDKVSIDISAGYSPAMDFAIALLQERPGMVIGLIPCAKSGSSIYDWQRNGNLDENTLYGSCLKRVRAASLMGNVAGILFFQGEIDTVDPNDKTNRILSANKWTHKSPNEWANKFTLLINNLRGDLKSPNLPVVFAQIGSNTEPERFINWAVVQQQQRSVKLPNSAMITTDDLALKDYVHFTTKSYQTIGQRFAKAYLSLQKLQP